MKTVLHVMIEIDQHVKLHDLAQKTGKSIAATVRDILDKHFAEQK